MRPLVVRLRLTQHPTSIAELESRIRLLWMIVAVLGLVLAAILMAMFLRIHHWVSLCEERLIGFADFRYYF